MKRIAVLGSTGSIGTQTLDVVRQHKDKLKVVALAAHSNRELLEKQADEFGARAVVYVSDGMQALCDVATSKDIDTVVVSVAGMIGLGPTIAALRAGKQVALASKEVLVAGGAVVMPLVTHDLALRPIDSEHSAVLQCLQGEDIKTVQQIILTASGGPFRGWSRQELASVTPEQALAHPTWRMGGKITIDSATLMNKGLEIIEACWLFGVAPDQVEVVIHPQSIVHSLVRFQDESVLAQLGHPDMKLPIQYALLGPHRLPSSTRRWDPLQTPALNFEPVDESVFTGPSLAKEAFRRGGVTAAYLNAANEVAANAFLRGEIRFLDIFDIAQRALEDAPKAEPTLDNILAADAEARRKYGTVGV